MHPQATSRQKSHSSCSLTKEETCSLRGTLEKNDPPVSQRQFHRFGQDPSGFLFFINKICKFQLWPQSLKFQGFEIKQNSKFWRLMKFREWTKTGTICSVQLQLWFWQVESRRNEQVQATSTGQTLNCTGSGKTDVETSSSTPSCVQDASFLTSKPHVPPGTGNAWQCFYGSSRWWVRKPRISKRQIRAGRYPVSSIHL